jgi:hypothetical protein
MYHGNHNGHAKPSSTKLRSKVEEIFISRNIKQTCFGRIYWNWEKYPINSEF